MNPSFTIGRKYIARILNYKSPYTVLIEKLVKCGYFDEVKQVRIDPIIEKFTFVAHVRTIAILQKYLRHLPTDQLESLRGDITITESVEIDPLIAEAIMSILRDQLQASKDWEAYRKALPDFSIIERPQIHASMTTFDIIQKLKAKGITIDNQSVIGFLINNPLVSTHKTNNYRTSTTKNGFRCDYRFCLK